MPKGVMVVRTKPAEGREDEFNDWYTNTHVPEILSVPGFVRARRFKAVDGDHYLAVYDIDADDITGPPAAFRAKSEAGETVRSDAMQLDPPPTVTLYEQISEA